MMAIAMASFMEALRKKIILLVGILTLVYLFLFGLIIYFTVKDISKMGTENSIGVYFMASQMISILGFYFSSMLVAFLTIMASVGSISSEIESGILHSIITRPIKRIEYVMGKYLGLAVLVITYSLLLFSSVLLICYLFKLPAINAINSTSLIKGFLYFILEPIAILSLSIFGSVVFKTLTNGIFVIAIYILGLIGGMMEQIGALIKNENLLNWGIFSSLISPFDVIYRLMTSTIFSNLGVTNPLFGPASLSNTTPSMWMLLYILIYILGLLVWSIRKFERKDI